MNSGKYTLRWKDAINAIIMMLIANMLMIVMAAADGKFPTSTDFKIGLINSVKFAIIPYLLKNFFTDDVKQAKSILTDKKIEDMNEKIKDKDKI
jgi:hypothetical protein